MKQSQLITHAVLMVGIVLGFSQGIPSGGTVTVTATVTGTPVDRLFVDLEVTQE